MATKATTKSKKPAAVKKTARTTTQPAKVETPVVQKKTWLSRFNSELSPQALLAELGGTFVLVSSVLFTSGDAFFTGLTVVVLAFGILAISGAHLNPAVSFGLWASRRISAVQMVTYWVAQFLGAFAAIALVHLFSGLAYDFSLASFGAFEPKIFFAELIGSAVFMFGLVAALNRVQGDSARAAGIGLSLFLGLVMATGLLSQAVQGLSEVSSDTSSESRLSKVNNVALNPAVALALTERDTSSTTTTGEETESSEPLPSRLTIEVIFGTFIGTTVGAYLYRLLAEYKR